MSALVPIKAGESKVVVNGYFDGIKAQAASLADRPRDEDLALYDRATARIAHGENYYTFIVSEHRTAHYPVRPGLAVRLPTLAYISALIGERGIMAAAVLLMLGVLLAWWRRLGHEPGIDADRRLWTMALLFIGASVGLIRHFFVLHELWAGMLLALSFGLHRPEAGGGKWIAAWFAAAAALALRELALPFVLLMAAYALWRRSWVEAAAWGLLVMLFAIGLAWHLSIIAAQTLPSDPLSPSWLAMRGLSGWLSNVTLSSNLRFLPHWLAGPLIVLMMLGWAGWKSPAGSFGALLFLGYGAAFMVASRVDNYYWGAMIAPALFIGLALAPAALRSLCRNAGWPLPNWPSAGRYPV